MPLALTADQLLAAVDARDANLVVSPSTWLPIFNRAAHREDLLTAFRFLDHSTDIVKAAQCGLSFALVPVPKEEAGRVSPEHLAGCVGYLREPATHPSLQCLLFSSAAQAVQVRDHLVAKGVWTGKPTIKTFRAADLVRVSALLDMQKRAVKKSTGTTPTTEPATEPTTKPPASKAVPAPAAGRKPSSGPARFSALGMVVKHQGPAYTKFGVEQTA
jgi:hypothetical protein